MAINRKKRTKSYRPPVTTQPKPSVEYIEEISEELSYLFNEIGEPICLIENNTALGVIFSFVSIQVFSTPLPVQQIKDNFPQHYSIFYYHNRTDNTKIEISFNSQKNDTPKEKTVSNTNKSKTKPKKRIINFQLDEADYVGLTTLAKYQDRPISSCLRTLIKQAVSEHKQTLEREKRMMR